MTETANIGNTYLIPKVVLSPITDDQSGVLDNNLEPPFVRVRNRNSSLTYIDNFSKESRISNNSYLISNPSGILAKRTKRFSFGFVYSSMATPNINPRNNTLVFETVAGSFTVTIPEGFYTRAQAITALVAALNSVPTGITFSANPQFVNSNVYTTITATGTFRFTGGTFVTTGYAFWGFLKGDTRMNTTTPFYLTLSLGPITCLYSRYWDIASAQMLQHTKASNTGNDVIANVLSRVYVIAASDGDPAKVFFQEFQINGENAAWNFDASHALSTVDLAIYDEFHQPYYLPNGDYSGATLQFALNNEL